MSARWSCVLSLWTLYPWVNSYAKEVRFWLANCIATTYNYQSLAFLASCLSSYQSAIIGHPGSNLITIQSCNIWQNLVTRNWSWPLRDPKDCFYITTYSTCPGTSQNCSACKTSAFHRAVYALVHYMVPQAISFIAFIHLHGMKRKLHLE